MWQAEPYRQLTGQNRSVLTEFFVALFNQYKRELALLFVAGDVILGFMLMSDVQSFVLKDEPKAAASVITTERTAPLETQAPVAVAPTPISPQWPLAGHVTAEFGTRTPYQRYHSGIDISSYQRAGRTDIMPVRGGTVTAAGKHGGLGKRVVIDHGDGITATYAHLNSVEVTVGQTVTPSDSLGQEGSTGNSTGPHLHLEIRRHGQLINPREFISGQPQ